MLHIYFPLFCFHFILLQPLLRAQSFLKMRAPDVKGFLHKIANYGFRCPEDFEKYEAVALAEQLATASSLKADQKASTCCNCFHPLGKTVLQYKAVEGTLHRPPQSIPRHSRVRLLQPNNAQAPFFFGLADMNVIYLGILPQDANEGPTFQTAHPN